MSVSEPLIPTFVNTPGFFKNSNGFTTYHQKSPQSLILLIVGILFCLIPCCWCIAPCLLLSSLFVTSIRTTFDQKSQQIRIEKVRSLIPGKSLQTYNVPYANVKEFISELDPTTKINGQSTFIVKVVLKTGERYAVSSSVVNPQDIIAAMKKEIVMV